MIYFDAAYVAKCYLNEPGADRVREVAYGADGLASCELARLEFASILKRHVREHHVTRREMTAILKEFEDDEKNGVWQWFGVTSELLERPVKPSSTFRARSSSDPVTRYTWPAPRNMALKRCIRTTATCCRLRATST